MTYRIVMILTLMLPLAGGVSAQQTATAAEAASPATPGEAEPNDEVRNSFTRFLDRRSDGLAQILVLEPSLLTNAAFLARRPELAEFIAAHPEIPRNPRFYLGELENRRHEDGVLSDIMEGLIIFSTCLLIALALAWFVRTIIEQKRWNRLARSQSEVHNKILDRFGTSAELLEYIRTPAGTKFLESAPIPLHTEKTPNAPITRIMRSIQLGVVVVISALGVVLISLRFDGQTGRDLFAMGVIALSIGAGFIASAVVSIVLSQRLGLWQGQGPGFVRGSEP